MSPAVAGFLYGLLILGAMLILALVWTVARLVMAIARELAEQPRDDNDRLPQQYTEPDRERSLRFRGDGR